MTDETGALAHITISAYGGWFHVQARTFGADKDKAKWMAERVLFFLAENRKAFLRNEPSSDSQTSFETGITEHQGYVRFSFRDEPGKWDKAKVDDGSVELSFVGAEHLEKGRT